MIISKTPFRVSLFGGSTDYESFYKKHGSLLIGFAIDKYCYATLRPTPKIFDYLSRISYSKLEVVDSNKNIEHNGVRGVLEYLDIVDGYEINHFSDLPSQTGIGSSSSFIVGLLKCFKPSLSEKELSRIAIYIERKMLNEAGGIQDQIWAAYGGFNSIRINKLGQFKVQPMPVSDEFVQDFIDRSIMIYTGQTRQSYKIAESHDSTKAEQHKLNILEQAKIAYDFFKSEDIDNIGICLDKSWNYKKEISSLISNSNIDIMYKSLQKDGMIGGKLLGTGGSGFIYGIVNTAIDKQIIKEKYNHNYIDINISSYGSKLIND